MARPTVASTAAAEGIDHGGTIRVGGTVGEIAEQVTALLSDPAQAAALGAAAREQVMRRYSWEARLQPLEQIMGLPHRSPKRTAAA